mgnify:CR=1 FL=1
MLLLSVGLSLANDPRPAESAGAGEMRSWRTAARHSAGLAPDPVRLADTAIVQVYAAATYGWRGYFAVHPWIIYKRAGDTAYTRYDVIGWGSRPVVRRNYAVPDGLWFGLSTRARIIIYNKAEGAPQGLANYADLASPALKGAICMRSSSNIYNISLLSSIIAHKGAAAAEAWTKGVVANFKQAPQGNDTSMIEAVAAGQCRVSVVNTYYLARYAGGDAAAKAMDSVATLLKLSPLTKQFLGVLAANGRLDVLMNNAGIFRPAQLLNTSTEQWNQTVAINQTGAFSRDEVGALNLYPFVNNTGPNLIGLFTLTYVPNYFDILPMYIVILALMPLMIFASKAHRYLPLFLMSIAERTIIPVLERKRRIPPLQPEPIRSDQCRSLNRIRVVINVYPLRQHER